MKRHVTPQRMLALAIALSLGTAQAATVIIEPDDYSGDVSNVAPGATLSTFRWNGMNSYVFHPALSIPGGTWSPTGKRVFGHRTTSVSETAHHWDNLNEAYSCEQGGPCLSKFYAFRVDFDTPTTHVSVLSTMRGEMAPDPVELSAFNANGDRILRCRATGIGPTVLASGVYSPLPRYFDSSAPQPWGTTCGAVIEKKNCAAWPNAEPGNCDYVISLRVIRRQSDIAYVMFAGPLWQNTWAPVDKLTYTYIPAP
jgi:hypothetical protein